MLQKTKKMIENEIIIPKLFQGVDTESVKQILSGIRYTKKTYSKDSIIVFQNDICVNVVILYSGTAVAEKINYGGKVEIIEEFTTPIILAPAFVYIKDNRFPVSVYATSKCEVLFIPRDDFMIVMQRNTKVLINFLQIISEQTYFLNKKLNVYKLNLKGKIADYLLTQMRMQGKDTFDMVSHQRLADLLGVARPSLSRTLTEMQQDKIILIDKKRVKILIPQALRKLAE